MLQSHIDQARQQDEDIKHIHFENQTMLNADISNVVWEAVQFIKCRFERCDFSNANFYGVSFINCDFSNCIFLDSYWKKTKITNCKGNGSDFSQSHFRECVLSNTSLCYANFSKSAWVGCVIEGCTLKEAFLTEAKLKSFTLKDTVLTCTDFFKTPLKGIDLSDCSIGGIRVSDTFKELRGVKITPVQAMDIIELFGVELV